jgi:hypothetical protein
VIVEDYDARMRSAWWVCVVAAAACGPVGSGARAPSGDGVATSSIEEGKGHGTAPGRDASPIVAGLSVARERVERDADVEVSVHIENRGKDPVILLAEELRSPAALFEVRDAMGKPIPPTSPPMPSGDEHVVAPGKAIDIRMNLAGMFSPPLGPGDYSIRLRRIDSTPHRFRIAPP